MGCWNETCGVTQLPITYGDEVVVYLLREYGSGGIWSLIPVPFFGTYNDYGWIDTEDNQQNKCDILSEYFQYLRLLKVDDVFVNLEKIEKYIHEGSEVFRNSLGYKQKCRIEFFMIHKRVWLDLTNVVQDYFPVENRDIADVVNELNPIVEKFNQLVLTLDGDKFVDEFTILKFKKTIKNRKDWSDVITMIFSNGFGSYLQYEPLYNFLNVCCNEDLVRTAAFMRVMFTLRKMIAPQTGSGSQEGVSIFHDILLESYETTLQMLKNKYD